jgi:hypothetical protein
MQFRVRSLPFFSAMLSVSVLLALAVWRTDARQEPKKDSSPKGTAATETPYEILGGVVIWVWKPEGDQFKVDCYVPGHRSAQEGRILRVDKSSLLLRSGADGKLTRIPLDDLFKADNTDGFQACVAPRGRTKNHSQLVHWLIVSDQGRVRPVPVENH